MPKFTDAFALEIYEIFLCEMLKRLYIYEKLIKFIYNKE